MGFACAISICSKNRRRELHACVVPIYDRVVCAQKVHAQNHVIFKPIQHMTRDGEGVPPIRCAPTRLTVSKLEFYGHHLVRGLGLARGQSNIDSTPLYRLDIETLQATAGNKFATGTQIKQSLQIVLLGQNSNRK